MTPLGKFIAEKRTQLGITQVQLAQAIGVTSAYVSRIESGLKRPANTSFLDKTAAVLHLSNEEKQAFLQLAQLSQRTLHIPDDTPLPGYKLMSTLAACLPSLSNQQLLLLDSVVQLTCRGTCTNEPQEEIM